MANKIADKSALYIASIWTIALGLIACSVVWDYSVIRHTLLLRFVVWSAVTIVLIGLLIFQRPDFSILRRNIFFAFGVFVLISAISGLKAINFGEWYFDLERYILMFIYFAAVSLALKDGSEIAKPLIVTVICIGIYGAWQLHSGALYAVATMGNRPLWSQYLLLMLPFCFMAKGWWRLVGYFGIAVIVGNLYLTFNRGAILALVVSSLVTVVIFKGKYLICFLRDNIWPKDVMDLFLRASFSLAIATIFIIIWPFVNYDRLLNTSSLHARFATWKQTMIMTSEHFMVGGGNWKIAILPYSSGFIEPNIGLTQYYLENHNAPGEVLAEKSIFGLIAYLSIFGLGLFYTYRSRNTWVFMGILAYMVYVFFDYKQYAPQLMLLATLLALAVRGYHKKLPKLNLRFSLPVCLIVLGIVLYGYGVRYKMERNFNRAAIAIRAGKTDKVIEELANIPKLATLEKHTAPYSWFLGDAYRAKGEKKKALSEFTKAYEANPNNIFVLLSFGESLFYAGYKDASLAMYKKALTIRPDNPIATKNIGLIRREL